MDSFQVRSDLVAALRDDLLGPDDDDPRDAVRATETLPSSPSHWYLAGFLAPLKQRTPEDEEDPGEEVLDSAVDDSEEASTDTPPARRPAFPSSLGVTVLLRAETTKLRVRVTYGTYAPVPSPATSDAKGATKQAESSANSPWRRTPHAHEVPLELLHRTARVTTPIEGSDGLYLQVVLREVPAMKPQLVPDGARYATVFLVNQRAAVKGPEEDLGFIFQAQLELSCAEGFIARPNLRGSRDEDDIDEAIGDLQYRDAFEYAVGHGVSVAAKVIGHGEDVFCHEVRSCWMPTAEVEKVDAPQITGVVSAMAALAELADGDAVRVALGRLAPAYLEWILGQEATPLSSESRRQTARGLLGAARLACKRIERGVNLLATEPLALEAFKTANRVMASQARAPRKLADKTAVEVPTWRTFQLAFLLMNLAGQMGAAEDPEGEREAVDLIFFPTGGGKTEAYLGLAAFTLVLRRLQNPGLSSAGVAVLMRYTLRLLTLDQLERAATLICALELERRKRPEVLGPHRFSVGLWVGKGATPNRFGTDKDHDESTARNRVLAFRKGKPPAPSPVPIDKCPWCGVPFGQDTFTLKPSSEAPQQLRIFCMKCDFKATRSPEGLPIVAVDDEIYRELPCFLIATVDKLASLPWVGKTGLLLGRHVTHHNALGFYGPGPKPPDAKALPTPLLPPDLIIQDELHLIAGPLGTLVGLYETAIDYLTTRTHEGRTIRPKIVASTATVRRALPQIRALFGRTRVDVFPPPGPNRRDSFFAQTLPTTKAHPRLYVGLAAPGRSQKVLLMRAYVTLLGAAQRAYEQDPSAADPYMTLVGYFNSLRELGGSRRIVEDEVRDRASRLDKRLRVGETTARVVPRRIDHACVELTSRETTDKVKIAKERLDQTFGSHKKDRPPVDVALASNMISVGLDIQRLGLMVVCGQPKTTAEYIQSTSRVGRDARRPGLVVTLLNVHKPRDRSHFEHFSAYHASFYRGVEATSVTPFSPRAVDRGLAGVTVALARLGCDALTDADAAGDIGEHTSSLGFVSDVLAARVEAHRSGTADDEPVEEIKAGLRQQVDSLLDSWVRVAANDVAGTGLAYQRFEHGQASKRPLLRMPLDPELASCDQYERPFVANRSMRDVEDTADVYVMKLKESTVLFEREGAGEETGEST